MTGEIEIGECMAQGNLLHVYMTLAIIWWHHTSCGLTEFVPRINPEAYTRASVASSGTTKGIFN